MSVRAVLAASLVLVVAGCAQASPPDTPVVETGVHSERIEHLGDMYWVVRIDLRRAHLDLFGQGTRGQPRTIGALDTTLAGHGLRRIAATNGGIYQPNLRPGGLHIEDGVTLQALNLREGAGNFHLMPNGVFYVDNTGPHVVNSTAYASTTARIATQSGPALVLDGQLHPAFMPQSVNKLPRNGVGVVDEHTVVWVMSEGSVRFHDMATLFRDVLHCKNALYLDGVISGLWADGFPQQQLKQRYASFLVVTSPVP